VLQLAYQPAVALLVHLQKHMHKDCRMAANLSVKSIIMSSGLINRGEIFGTDQRGLWDSSGVVI